MSYSIIFKTKVLKLSDGRLLHLSLQGCNNDTEGRRDDDWRGKIYTKTKFVEYAENFMKDSKPIKESDGFDLKIGSRYCTWYDYGKHLLRMMDRATSFQDFIHSGRYITFERIDGFDVKEAGNIIFMSPKEFEEYYYHHIYQTSFSYTQKSSLLATEPDIIKAFDDKDVIRICISK